MLLVTAEHFISLIFALVLILIGFYFRKHYYIEIGSNGISLPSSRINTCNWLYAQIIGSRILIRHGAVALLITACVNIALMVLKLWNDSSLYIGIAIGGVALFLAMCNIDKKVSSFNPSWLENDNAQKKEKWIADVIDSINKKQFARLESLANEAM